MPKHDANPLTAAATVFDAELAIYARLGDLFLKTPLTTLKQLERANQVLGELGDCETRLQAAAQQLIGALSSSRQEQEQLSSKVIAHAPSLQARNAQVADLLAAMSELASAVAKLNELVATSAITDGATTTPDPGEISTVVLALSERAEQLAAASRTAELDELATQAHSLHQRLKVIGMSLAKAAGN